MIPMQLHKKLQKRIEAGNYRKLQAQLNLIDFSSNDILGISKELKDVMAYGSTGSRLLTGNTSFVEDLETRIATFHKAEAGLLFNSGFVANLGLLSAIAEADDVIIYDAHVHASTKQSIALSKCKAIPFRHQNLNHLESRLKVYASRKSTLYVCVESIYSCDGTITSIADVVVLCEKYGAFLIVDEAHANGIYGPLGAGLALHPSIFARIYTFSKALGAHGAIVVGSKKLKDYLINFSLPFIYTTALPMGLLQTIDENYQKAMCADLHRQQILKLIRAFRKRGEAFPFHPSQTHIQTLLIPGNRQAKQFANSLQKRGFDVRALLSPTVQRGKERLRFILHSFNTTEQIDQLFENIKELYAR